MDVAIVSHCIFIAYSKSDIFILCTLLRGHQKISFKGQEMYVIEFLMKCAIEGDCYDGYQSYMGAQITYL